MTQIFLLVLYLELYLVSWWGH